MRIVSLLPSATEIVCALGLDDMLVGVTHECDHPASVLGLPRVTNTLIPTELSSREIDAMVRQTMGTGSALYTLNMPVLEPETLDQVLACVHTVAAAAGVPERGERTVRALRARIDRVVACCAAAPERPRVALLEWVNPPFSTGHWNPELVRLAGGIDGLGRAGEKSVQIAWQRVIEWQPEVVVISCCGFTAERALREAGVLRDVAGWDDLPAVRGGRVFVTDGNAYFSRPGPRLVDSLELLGHLLHPDHCELPLWVMPPLRLQHLRTAAS